MVDAKARHQLEAPLEIRERRIHELDVLQDVIAGAEELHAVAQSHLRTGRAAFAHDVRKQNMGVDIDRAYGQAKLPRRRLYFVASTCS